MTEPDDELLAFPPFPPLPPLTDLSLEEPTGRAEVLIVRDPERPVAGTRRPERGGWDAARAARGPLP